MLQTEGDKVKFLTPFDTALQGDVVWSPDSQFAAYSWGEVFLVDAARGETKMLTNNGTNKVLFDWR